MRALSIIAILAATMLVPAAAAHSDDGTGAPAIYGPTLDGAGQGDYSMDLACGEQPGAENDLQQILCPLAIYDEEDIMGSPRLVLHPKDPNIIAFNALHGGPGLTSLFGEPPAAWARNNAVHQPHTTFRTVNPYGVLDGGQLDWKDQPYYSHFAQANTTEAGAICPPLCPSRILSQNQVYGMDNALAVDGKGRLYEASLYAMRDADAAPWEYGVTVWKQRGVQYDRDQDTNYRNLLAETAGNTMDTLDLAYVDGPDQALLVWREATTDASGPLAGDLKSWIAAAWSDVETSSPWTTLAPENVVGPCDEITNVATWNGAAYVGCVAGAGYAMRDDAKPGNLDLWRIQVPQGRMEYVSTIPLDGTDPRLAARDDGAFVAAATRPESTHKVHVELSFGDYAKDWSAPLDYGHDLQDEDREIVGARVNALAYHQKSGNVFLLYWEQYDTGSSSPTAQSATSYNKRFASIHERAEGAQAVIDLRLGNATTRRIFPPSVEGLDNEAVYNDLHDDVHLWYSKDLEEERVFVAYGDYGLVRFAELEQENEGLIVGLGPEPPPVPNAVPDPSTSQQAAQAAAGIFAGALTLAMAARLLLSRSKSKIEAPSLGGK